MTPKEKAIKYLKDNALKPNGLFCYEIVSDALDIAIREQKLLDRKDKGDKE